MAGAFAPAIAISFMQSVGIDLGGTTFAAGAVTEKGEISHVVEYETRQHEAPDRLLPRLADAAQAVITALSTNSPNQEIGAVGIGVPGPVRPYEGVCVIAPNLNGWKNLQVAEPLRARLNRPVCLVNDAKAAALAEARFGAGRGAHSMLMLTLGTGIGSGLVINGQLHLGATQRGAEVGHTTIDLRSSRGSAGNIGTVESLCGRDAIVWRALRRLANGRASSLSDLCEGDLTAITPQIIAQAAHDGDAVAREVWDDTAACLAAAVVNVVLTVDVDCVVLGGGVALAGDILFEPLRRAVAARTTQLHFDATQIVPALLGPDAGIIGAAQWAREQAN